MQRNPALAYMTPTEVGEKKERNYLLSINRYIPIYPLPVLLRWVDWVHISMCGCLNVLGVWAGG